MVQILPGILEKTFTGVQEKVARIGTVVPMAQLDITDGIFVPEESWHAAPDLNKLQTELVFDLHLMVDKPEQWFSQWAHPLIKRFTFHFEATYDVRRTMELAKSHNKDVGIALKMETPISVLRDVANEITVVLLMAIEPGGQGRPFDPKVVDKAAEIRNLYPKLGIGVDGGVNPMVAPSLIEAGATELVSGSFLLNNPDIAQGVRDLQGNS